MKLELSNKQKLVLHPNLQNSIQILQLNHLDLTQHLTKLLEENPFIDLNDDYDSSEENHGAENDFWHNIEDSPSIYSFFAEQIRDLDLNNNQKSIANCMVSYLDENGFFKANLAELAKEYNTDQAELTYVLTELKTLEPVGVFAESLAESLSLQLIVLGLYNQEYQTLLSHLDLIASCDHSKLAKILNVEIDQIKGMIIQIKKLEPRPLGNFNFNGEEYIIPEVNVEYIDNQIKLRFNSVLSKLKMNDIHIGNKNEFLREKMSEAKFLFHALKQREDNLAKVSEYIFEKQKNFIKFGVGYLAPMTMLEVANEVALSESTISRIVNGKYATTPRGTFELRYFFSNGLTNKFTKSEISNVSIMDLIKQLIDGEESDHILSDDEITEILRKKNIEIARRTVAKYREKMKIPTSNLRKRFKRL